MDFPSDYFAHYTTPQAGYYTNTPDYSTQALPENYSWLPQAHEHQQQIQANDTHQFHSDDGDLAYQQQQLPISSDYQRHLHNAILALASPLESSPFAQLNASATLFKPPLPSQDLSAPSPPSLSLYSASGFDALSVLAKVANRPCPCIPLGPVDMTCSFVVVDVRQDDDPIVYCSPSFCQLTGYSEEEILGRNCRFLQAPGGQVERGKHRYHTSNASVAHLKQYLSAHKECQACVVNYKKNGTSFVNLVTVIPIFGGVGDSEIVYHVGFQVDLDQHPHVLRARSNNGHFVVHYSSQQQHYFPAPLPPPPPLNHPAALSRERKSQKIPSVMISKDLKKLLDDPAFLRSIPISSSTTFTPSQPSSVRAEADASSIFGGNQLLHLLLLEVSPDFVFVVSLKGSFLYVAPSVRRVLGYEPEEMVGKSISDYAHPEDVVPLMRELKEGSATGLATVAPTTTTTTSGGNESTGEGPLSSAAGTSAHPGRLQIAPRTIDLLFRARTKGGAYVWVESKGRLYPEPGKGRKAIILSGRTKEMSKLDWDLITDSGGFNVPVSTVEDGKGGKTKRIETDVWGMVTSGRCSGGVVSFLVLGPTLTDLLGWTPAELIGREVTKFVVQGAESLLAEVRSCDADDGVPNLRMVYCTILHKNGSMLGVCFVLYPPSHDLYLTHEIRGIMPAPLIFQIRLMDHSDPLPSSHIYAPPTILASYPPGPIIYSPPSSYSSASLYASTSSLPSAQFQDSSVPPALRYYESAPSLSSYASALSSGGSAAPPHPSTSSSDPSAPFIPIPTGDVFEPLDTRHDTSWQYELQQVRFANLRLREEISAMEGRIEEARRTRIGA